MSIVFDWSKECVMNQKGFCGWDKGIFELSCPVS